MESQSWINYFLKLAREASSRSVCFSRKFGAVIVKNRCVVSMGYNGPARGASHCNQREYGLPPSIPSGLERCPRKAAGFPSGEGVQYCVAGHAERNAIAQAAMNGISTLGAAIYTWSPMPCKECAISIVNSGIREVYYLDRAYDAVAEQIFREAGIQLYCIDSKTVI